MREGLTCTRKMGRAWPAPGQGEGLGLHKDNWGEPGLHQDNEKSLACTRTIGEGLPQDKEKGLTCTRTIGEENLTCPRTRREGLTCIRKRGRV